MKKINALLLDDDSSSNFIAKEVLRESRLVKKIFEFQNPFEAIEFIKQALPEKFLVDMIMLDINMPLIDGWDFLEELEKISPEGLEKPVIYMLSSTIRSSDIEKARDHHLVNDFLPKPLQLQSIKSIVQSYWKRPIA